METFHRIHMEPNRPADSTTLRVLLVSASSGSRGGGEFYGLGLAEGLRAMGQEVTALLASHPRMDELAALLRRSVPVERFDYLSTYDRRLRAVGAALDRRTVRRLAGEFRRRQPDLIHMNKQNLEDGLDLLTAADRSGIPFVSTIHITRSMTSLGAKAGRIRDWIALRTLGRSQGHYLLTADACLKELRTLLRGRVLPSRLHCVRNGVADVPPGDRREVRREWGLRDDDVVLGCVARIESQKNPLFLVRLLPLLPPQARLVWVGDGRLRQEVLEEAAQCGVADRVHVDGWHSDARQRMAGFDLYVLPSHFEGFPFAVLEAMAAGLPCVASDVDGIREAILDQATGRLCPCGDREAWLTALKRLVEDPDQRASMGRNARRHYEEQFSLQKMARETINVYHKVLGRP